MLPAVMVLALKRLRASQPFNRLATSAVRAVFSATGLKSEFVVRHLHRVGEVSALLPNGACLRIFALADDGVANGIFWHGWRGYEDESSPLYYRLASSARVTLDIGAHVGYYAILAGHANPGGQVFAFEPHAAVRMRFEENVRRNGLSNVRCIGAAVGERDGEIDFYTAAACGVPSMSSTSLEIMKSQGPFTKSSVPLVTIDRFIREHGIKGVDLVKIDTESTEPQVLDGMRETVARDRPRIICEVLAGFGVEARLQAYLRCFGYHAFHLTPQGPVLREDIQPHPVWRNFLFSPEPTL